MSLRNHWGWSLGLVYLDRDAYPIDGSEDLFRADS